MPVSPVSYYNMIDRVCEAYEYSVRMKLIDALTDKSVAAMFIVVAASVFVYAIKNMRKSDMY